MSERRLYVHEGGLQKCVLTFPRHGAVLMSALGLSVASRIARHHLVVNGEEIAFVPRATFEPAVRKLDATSCHWLTVVLRRLVYTPVETKDRDETRTLLGSGEAVVATCRENGYFTFATGSRSATIMFEETGSSAPSERESECLQTLTQT
jgi:hypothetical protein